MYVAARGGEHAIEQAERLYHALKSPLTRDSVESIQRSLPWLLDRVMGEASLYAVDLAALAIAQTGGDLYEAVMLLRAYRSTQPRIAYAEPLSEDHMICVRRISAAFKDIPGGQILGPTLDYTHRLMRMDVLDGEERGASGPVPDVERAETTGSRSYAYVADWQRQQGLVGQPDVDANPADAVDLPDLTRGPLLMPPPRATRLQALARAETGGVLALGYANMRGYGAIHPTVNEVRLAYAEVRLAHPETGAVFSLGRIRVSHAEVVASNLTFGMSPLQLGYCGTLGWNEVKTIAGSMLDLAMDKEKPHPAHEEEFVLYHTEVVESSGFCIHFKLPHYVTFGSSLDALRDAAIAMGWVKGTSGGKSRAYEVPEEQGNGSEPADGVAKKPGEKVEA